MPARANPPPGDYLIVAYGGFSKRGWWTNALADIYLPKIIGANPFPQALPANQPRGGHPRSRASPFGAGQEPRP